MVDHRQSYKNLVPAGSMKSGDVFTRTRPAWRSIIGSFCWGVVTYLLAWFALKKRERV